MSLVRHCSGVAIGLALASCAERRDDPARAGAARTTAPAQSVVRLLDLPGWRIGDRAATNDEVASFEVCGDLRPGFAVESGVELRCELTLPAAPSWLDVDVAVLERAGESIPPPRARLAVAQIDGGRSTTLYDAVPSPGTPPTAFGFASARIEVVRALGRPCELSFRVTSADGDASRRVVLGNPRFVPRSTAAARSHVRVELFCEAPDAATLDSAPAGEWAAFRALVAEGATWRSAADLARPRLPRDSSTELAWFGPLDELGASPIAGRILDQASRLDPWRFRSDDPFVAAHRAWDEALLRDRFRALGERALFRTIAQPRQADLCVFVATSARGEALDGALARLLAHLRANELWDRTDLLIRAVRAGEPGSETGAWVRAAKL